MQSSWKTFVIIGLGLVLCGLAACTGGGGGEQDEAMAQRKAELTALQTEKQALDALREELAQLRQDMKSAGEEGEQEEAPQGEAQGAAGEEGAEARTPEQMEARAEELKQEIQQRADTLGSRVVAFINDEQFAPAVGEPFTEDQRAALDIKIDEDIRLAQEYIEQGGDWKRAIDIYQDLLRIDPDNPRLQAALETAEEMRYMTEERFAQVKKGMTEDEVREALGPVNLRNVRTYEDKGRFAWFYPREDKGAAGVFFQARRGKNVVYAMDFNAVEPKEEPEVIEPGQ